MKQPIEESLSPGLLIAAAETEDEVGTVLRIHLFVEQLLVWYITRHRTGELASYVKEPRDFSGKMSVAAAFGLPLTFVRIDHQVNVIRNRLAHRESVLGTDDVQQLVRQVARLVEVDPTFTPLPKRYLELPVKRPGERLAFGEHGARYDFLIATVAFLGTACSWASAQEVQ